MFSIRTILVLIVTLIITIGCASRLTPEQREWRQGIDKENLVNCLEKYKNQRVAFVSLHRHDKHKKHSPLEIKEDLVVNQCKLALGEAFIKY